MSNSRARRLLAEKLRERSPALYGPEAEVNARDLWAEEPVDLTTFVRDKKFLNSPPLSDIQFDAVRHMEQVYLPETYLTMVEEFGPQWEPVRFVNLISIQWGKGSGKDSTCRIAVARAAYMLMCLESPQDYFGLPPQDEIQTLNMAASGPQAHRAFFRPLATMIRKSPWFKDKLRAEPTDMSASIRLIKQVEMVSGHSMADTLEGLNLILAIADEISAFKTKDELERFHGAQLRDSPQAAESIMKMLRTSAATRFPWSYKVAAISYPRYKGDAIQQLCSRGREDLEKNGARSRHYVSGPWATWDVNPRVPSKDVFAEDYADDPDMAEAMYECLPRLSPNRFFKNDQAIYAAVGDENGRKCPITIDYCWAKEESAEFENLHSKYGTPIPTRQWGWTAEFKLAEDFHPMRGALYAIHGDLAISGDRAGVALSHVQNWERIEGSAPRPSLRLDFVTAFEADATALAPDGTPAPREVQIRWFRKLVVELIKRKFAIRLATFDNFQSVDSMQILESWGIESKKLSTDTNNIAYNTLRDVLYDSRMEGHYAPVARDELLSLTKLPNGKLDHVPGGSKDMADAIAGSVCGAIELGGDEGEDPERADIDGNPEPLSVAPGRIHGELAWLQADEDAMSLNALGPSEW